MAKTEITFLGTNGWYTTPTGNTTCVLLDTPDAYIILDAGNGIYMVDRYITDQCKPIYLFLSHFHLDHIIGLHTLNKFKFSQGYTICCYKGGRKILNTIMRQPFTVSIKNLPTTVKVREIPSGYLKGFPFKVQALDLKHSSRCFGYRFELHDKVIAYCTDTGLCDNAFILARQADVLIAECAYLSGQQVASWPHLNPEQAGKLALDSHVKNLVLMHFDAANYPTLAKRQGSLKSAKKIFSSTIAAYDGFCLEIKHGR